MKNPGEMLIYQSEDGRVRLETRLENETLWMTQIQMAELFQTTQQNISLHIQNIYEEGELNTDATHKKSLWVRQEGNRQVERELDTYNLDVVISVGYRVKSLIATRFRIWATAKAGAEFESFAETRRALKEKQAEADYFKQLENLANKDNDA